MSGLVFDNFYTYPPSTSSVSLPSGTIKSARIYRNGSCQYGTRLYRIKVEAEADECIKKTASFVKEGTEIGSAPGEIEVCEDASITIPGKVLSQKLAMYLPVGMMDQIPTKKAILMK